jgi:hypothetical protein
MSAFDRVLGLLFVVLAMGGTAAALAVNERHALDDPLQKAERGEVTGIGGLSLLRAPNLRRALAAADRALKDDEQVTSLRLAPTRIDIQARDTIGAMRQLQLRVDIEAHVVSTSGTSSDTGPRSLAGIDTAAPERFVRAIAEREGYPPDHLDYLVLQLPPDEVRWDGFWVKVPIERNHFSADAHGRVTGP